MFISLKTIPSPFGLIPSLFSHERLKAFLAKLKCGDKHPGTLSGLPASGFLESHRFPANVG